MNLPDVIAFQNITKQEISHSGILVLSLEDQDLMLLRDNMALSFFVSSIAKDKF